MTTKEKIMDEALTLFSCKGYDPVSVRDIANAVGIKESSIYNHFKNKQHIFDSILEEYSGRAAEFFHMMNLAGEDRQFLVDTRTVDMYVNMTPEQFLNISSSIFEFYFTDEINIKLRKMLTIEQYRNEHISKLFRELSFEGSIKFQTELFDALIKAGAFKKTDPYMMALQFNAPIFLIFYKYDNNEQSLPEARELFMRHVRHFNETYKNS